MGKNFWVSEKGRVLGPFTIDKLMELVEENWLSKMHLISDDKTTWINAADYESGALWKRPDTQNDDEIQLVDEHAESNEDGPESPNPNKASMWWYTKNGQQAGPIPFPHLKDLLDRGNLKPNDHIWTEGMKDWAAAHTMSQQSNNDISLE